MSRCSGVIGLSTVTKSTDPDRPGVFADVITEKPYKGTLLRSAITNVEGSGVLGDLRSGHRVQTIMTDFLRANYSAIRFVTVTGVAWSVVSVDQIHPNITLTLGGVYNGARSG